MTPDANGWRPIEEAPKDRLILAGFRNAGHWAYGLVSWSDKLEAWADRGTPDEPTIWQALPSLPPAPQLGDEG